MSILCMHLNPKTMFFPSCLFYISLALLGWYIYILIVFTSSFWVFCVKSFFKLHKFSFYMYSILGFHQNLTKNTNSDISTSQTLCSYFKRGMVILIIYKINSIHRMRDNCFSSKVWEHYMKRISKTPNEKRFRYRIM